jgi:hypothetical protein
MAFITISTNAILVDFAYYSDWTEPMAPNTSASSWKDKRVH